MLRFKFKLTLHHSDVAVRYGDGELRHLPPPGSTIQFESLSETMIPVYPARVSSVSYVAGADEGSDVLLVLIVDASNCSDDGFADLVRWFERSMRKAGWSVWTNAREALR